MSEGGRGRPDGRRSDVRVRPAGFGLESGFWSVGAVRPAVRGCARAPTPESRRRSGPPARGRGPDDGAGGAVRPAVVPGPNRVATTKRPHAPSYVYTKTFFKVLGEFQALSIISLEMEISVF